MTPLQDRLGLMLFVFFVGSSFGAFMLGLVHVAIKPLDPFVILGTGLISLLAGLASAIKGGR